MRQRDADLGVGVHDQAGAVEAGRARTTVDIRHAEVLHRDPDDTAVDSRRSRVCLERVLDRRRHVEHGRRFLGLRSALRLALQGRRGQPGAGRGCSLLLPPALRGLEARDLILDRGEEPLALGQLALDRAALLGPLGDDVLLRSPGALQPDPPLHDLLAEALHLAEHATVLRRHALDRVEAVEQVVDRLGGQHDLERALLVPADVERDEPLGQVRLTVLEALLRDLQVSGVGLELAPDLVELDVREVVGLDRVRQLRVDLLDLGEDARGLGPFGADARVCGRGVHAGQGCRHESRRENCEKRRRLLPARAAQHAFRSNTRGDPVGARSVTSRAP